MIEFLAILSVWKLTEALVSYDGPLKMFKALKRLVGGSLCFFCLSVWVAFPLAMYLSTDLNFFIYLLGLSGGASIINEMLS